MSNETQEGPQVNAYGPGEYTFRQGKALEVRAPKAIVLDGTLPTPADFLVGKTFAPETCHLRIFKDKGRLELHVHDTDPFTEHVIGGSLKRDGVLDQFHLNTDTRWTNQEFLAFIKTMKYYFPDKTQHKTLVESLMKWTAQINTVLSENQDTKGNSKFELERKVQGVPLMNKFTIEVPIFQGYDKQKFDVEIGLDPKALSVDIYLISDNLIELEIGLREGILADELKRFDKYTFSKVVIS